MSTTSRSFFEGMYQRQADPWSFATDAYEQDRYRTILRHVPEGRFARVFEPGCSIGELTRRLASRCGSVVAMDISDTAVLATRARCHQHANVSALRGTLPEDLPVGPFDLIVLSEIGYYLSEPVLTTLAGELTDRLAPRGMLLAAHWTGESVDHPLAGERVHEVLRAGLAMQHRVHEQHSSKVRNGFVLDIWDCAGSQAAIAS